MIKKQFYILTLRWCYVRKRTSFPTYKGIERRCWFIADRYGKYIKLFTSGIFLLWDRKTGYSSTSLSFFVFNSGTTLHFAPNSYFCIPQLFFTCVILDLLTFTPWLSSIHFWSNPKVNLAGFWGTSLDFVGTIILKTFLNTAICAYERQFVSTALSGPDEEVGEPVTPKNQYPRLIHFLMILSSLQQHPDTSFLSYVHARSASVKFHLDYPELHSSPEY